MSLFLGIDTSNYTTSVALYENGRIVKNCKLPVFVRSGEKGVRQSDAVFSHTKNLPEVIAMLGKITPTAIGVSVRPRDVEGSYMPCFLSGYAVAASLASLYGLPLYTFSHQAGHVRAALYSAGCDHLVNERLVAFHVSGGTTEMLLYDKGEILCVGGTLDLNAGQLIDRIGVMMEMPFPCGKEMENTADFDAMKAEGLISKATVNGLYCNLSGLENKASAYLKNGATKAAVSAFVLASVEKTLSKLTENAIDTYGKLPILFSGGVSSNRYLKKVLSKKFGAFFAEPEYSADNAAGIAILCKERYDECHKTN